MEGEGGALFAHYDLFFPLDSQIARIFYSMMRLTAIRVVTCVTRGWLFVQAKRGQLAAYLKMVSGQERLCTQALCLMSGWKVCLGLACK